MEYTIEIRNEKVLQVLFDIAKESGVEICSTYERDRTNGWGFFVFNTDRNKVFGSRANIEKRDVLSIDSMIVLLEDNKRNKLRLNEDYTAEINRDKKVVNVGCQTFSFEVINKLSEMIKE